MSYFEIAYVADDSRLGSWSIFTFEKAFAEALGPIIKCIIGSGFYLNSIISFLCGSYFLVADARRDYSYVADLSSSSYVR